MQSSRASADAPTLATWRPPAPLEAGPSPRAVLGHLPELCRPADVNVPGEDFFDIPWAASWAMYPQLYALGQLIRPQHVLEIGTFWGYGIAAFAQGCGATLRRITLIDAELYFRGGYLSRAYTNLRSLFPPPFPVNIFEWNTRDGLPAVVGQPPVDCVIVDGDHTYEGALRDLRLVWPDLTPGGWLLLDDVHSMPAVRDAARAFARETPIAANLEVFTRTLDRPRGLYVMRKP